MNRTQMCARFALAVGLIGLTILLASPDASASPYGSVTVVPIQLGPGLIKPANVFGKEYSHDLDMDAAGLLDPQQIIAWDGSGGVGNGLDFTGTRIIPPNTYTPDDQIDAIANGSDLFYTDLRSDRAHLVFSIDDEASAHPPLFPTPPPTPIIVPSAGLIPLANGNLIGGAGEISYELGVGFGALPSTQGRWATQAQINDMPLPIDVDGLEVWGPEPGFTADTNKYSLEDDVFSGVSVWNGSGTPYISHAAVVAVVTSLLGPLPVGTNLHPGLINLDALMVHEIIGNGDTFDREPAGAPGDEILFSIRQIIDPTDPTGYYATGSEIFFMNATGFEGFLLHGGHLWDKAYALSDMISIIGGAAGQLVVQHDLNALEAVADVPEPTSVMLLLLGMATCAGLRRRR